jgi:hypothetical protein
MDDVCSSAVELSLDVELAHVPGGSSGNNSCTVLRAFEEAWSAPYNASSSSSSTSSSSSSSSGSRVLGCLNDAWSLWFGIVQEHTDAIAFARFEDRGATNL